MAYVDGFLIPVPRSRLAAYRRMAEKAGEVWRRCGALEYRECVGEDLDVKMGTAFPKQLGAKRGETVVFSWIVYESRAHRDAVNAEVMKDPWIAGMDGKAMPFDPKRMCYGGFESIVDLAGPASKVSGRAGSGARRKPAVRRPSPPSAGRTGTRGGGRRARS
jgi:uncharacterized protein YbaA (DUF1428 family)